MNATGAFPRNHPLTKIFWLVVVLGIILRILFPLADPPTDLTISGAPVGDPGQHSYGARNSVLFGQWYFDDWKPHLASPLISTALNRVTYHLFGVSFPTHKAVPIAFSILAFLAFLLLVTRRLPPLAVTAAALFSALSYPLLMYSHTANRYMPMIFFFILAVHLFVRGAETGRTRDFLFSATFFLCAYASQNHILYMSGFFAVLSGFWLLRKGVRFPQLAVFWSIVTGGMAAWYFLIFVPNQDFFAHFVAHNKLVRQIRGLDQIFANILGNPFARQFRNDIPLLLLAALGITAGVLMWLRRRGLPPIVEAGILWLVLSAGFHSLWGYRPTRFYLIPILGAALVGSWLLEKLVTRSPMRWRTREFSILAAGLAMSLLLLGFRNYGGTFLEMVANHPLAAAFILAAAAMLLLLVFAPSRWRATAAVGLLVIAAAVNLTRYAGWAAHREYRVTECADILTRALPPTRIAGNWASILSIGSPHRTHLLSGEMGINWRPDFLEQQDIRYLLLTRGPFADEYREYMRLFSRQLRRARLAAVFPIYTARVQLWRLFPEPGEESRIEMETLTQRPARVVLDPPASGHMALEIPEKSVLNLPIAATGGGDPRMSVELRARGRFRLRVFLVEGKKVLRRNLVLWNSRDYSIRGILDGPIPEGTTLEIRITSMEPGTRLDRIDRVIRN